ncbi:hda (nucleomorph) [Hemiselmis andersenii]|uniref:Histone deacetylase n=1 Tax=Hemiselmis andersenii TaxID=464988 RepID=A9BLD3_HEMAN|nr:hda [Hemiselmis andersenii]ABW98316.1 hda [Hemiselmis andersenii]|mmetsp:Transcript_14153/g.32759  ORF Transcript_14153/g.32759 Transcript_14153/m.32759 type:complete len:378 (+) Transcript_14153:110-1243(+)
MKSFFPTYSCDFTIGDYFYGTQHPMKPFRLTMLQDLIWSYGLQNFLNLKYHRKTEKKKFLNFHSANFFEKITPEKIFQNKKFFKKVENFYQRKIFEDCPIFNGILEYCQKYTGSSLSATEELVKKNTFVSINWSGGLHHSKADAPSGFCYTNDIVLSILELLRIFSRVLYIDIDVHHGDGVEEAFYLSNRVFTLSFHNYQPFFFPETGNILDKGLGPGENFSANVNLKPGLSDKSFEFIFNPLVDEIIKKYKPKVIVLQCGADSLSGDHIGVFNLSLKGHATCIKFLKGKNIPLLVLGGGGYTIPNVVRCWTYETSLLVRKEISFSLPFNNFWEYFYPTNSLTFNISDNKDRNSKKELQILKKKIFQNISCFKNFKN